MRDGPKRDDDGIDPADIPPEVVPFLQPYRGPELAKSPELEAAIQALRDFEKQEAEDREREAPPSTATEYVAPVAPPKSHERTQEMDRVKISAAVAPAHPGPGKGPHDTAKMALPVRVHEEDSSAEDTSAVVPKPRRAQRPTVTLEQRSTLGRRRSRAGIYAIITAIALVAVIAFVFISGATRKPDGSEVSPTVQPTAAVVPTATTTPAASTGATAPALPPSALPQESPTAEPPASSEPTRHKPNPKLKPKPSPSAEPKSGGPDIW